MGLQVNLIYPGGRRGSPKAGMGCSATRHLQHSAWVLSWEHGRLV